jgi:hypothetical protein
MDQPHEWPLNLIICLLKINFEYHPALFLPMQFMYSLMKNHHTLHNIHTWNKRRLSWMDHHMSHRGKPVSQHLGEDLEAHIKKT